MSLDLLAAGTLVRGWVAQWAAGNASLRDGGEGPWLTGRDLLAPTEVLARRLSAAGAGPGTRVVVSGPTCVATAVAHVAVLRAGAAVVPVNPAYAAAEWAAVLAAAAPVAVIRRADATEFVADALQFATLEGDGLPPPDPAAVLDAAGPDDPALVPFTSGTTGAPKGVVLTHANLLASAAAVVAAWHWTADDTLHLCLPLFHMHGMGVGLHGTLLAGARAELYERFDPKAVLAGDTTMFFGVPTMYGRLANADGLERLRRKRLCVSGSAPLDADLHRSLRAAGIDVLERYGMTETVMLVSNPYDGERRPGTVGLPLPGVEVRLADGSGEIEVRGPNVFAGYLDAPEATAAAFTADGWFRTGDVGEHDEAGYLRIVGRTKDLIITGGYNVYPREVEDVLRAHPSVVDAAVVGRRSPEWGEVVTAYVEVSEAVDPSTLVAFAAERLVAYKRPRAVNVVDALPRNALGKVVKAQLG